MLKADLKTFLRETKNWELNEWEEDFVISLKEMLDDDYPPVTQKQEAVMDKMRDKYE